MTGATAVARFEILLVEDNEGDARLAVEALAENAVSVRTTTVQDGVEALTFLRRQGKHAGASRPDLILLDLNLPKKDGREVLAEIKGDPYLKQIPVIVLTTSRAEEDIRTVYDLHANCYIAKPMNWEEFSRVVKMIEDFWLTIASLPTKEKR